MTKDEILNQVFDAISSVPSTRAHGVCKMLRDGQIMYLCGQGMLFGDPTDEEARLEPNVFRQYAPDADVLPVSPSLPFSVEHMLEVDRLQPMSVGPDVLYVPVAKPPTGEVPCILEVSGSDNRCLCVSPVGKDSRFAEQQIRVWSLPDSVVPIAEQRSLADLDFTLAVARQTSKARPGLVGVITGETRVMFFMLSMIMAPIGPITMGSGKQYDLTAFDDVEATYKAMKERKMSKLDNPTGKAAPVPPPQLTIPSPAPSPAQAPVPPPVAEPAPAPAPSSVAAPTVEQQIQQAAAEAAEAEIADGGVEVTVGDKKVMRKAKPATTVGFDFTKVIEYVGSPVSLDKVTPEKIVEELRNLRDLQIACARRSLNLATGALDLYKADAAKYAELRKLIK